jgi:hypothetical protein
VTIHERNGVVVRIIVLPLLESVPFSSALSRVERLAKALHIWDEPLVQERVKQWTGSAPSVAGLPVSVSTGGAPEKAIKVFLELRPIGESSWYIVINVDYIKDEELEP